DVDLLVSLFFSTLRPPPTLTLFPYTTLFRSPRRTVSKSRRSPRGLERSRGSSAMEPGGEFRTSPPARLVARVAIVVVVAQDEQRSEEHTSELQSRGHLVCRLLLEKKR